AGAGNPEHNLGWMQSNDPIRILADRGGDIHAEGSSSQVIEPKRRIFQQSLDVHYSLTSCSTSTPFSAATRRRALKSKYPSLRRNHLMPREYSTSTHLSSAA